MNLNLLNDIKKNYNEKRNWDGSTIKTYLEESGIFQYPGNNLLDRLTQDLMDHHQLNVQQKEISMEPHYELAKMQMELFFLIISTEEGVSEEEQKICLDIISSSFGNDGWSYGKLKEELHTSSLPNVDRLCEIMEDSVRMAICRKINIKIEDLKIEYSKQMLLAAYDIENAIQMQLVRKSNQYREQLIMEGRLPKGMISSKIYAQSELDFIARQWEVFTRLCKENIKISDVKVRDGQVLLSKGDLIHGIVRDNPQVLQSIAETGILAGELVGVEEDGETYGCADFYKVRKDATLEDSLNQINNKVPNSNRTVEDNSVALIIQQADLQSAKQLSEYDAYADTDKGNQVKQIVADKLPLTSENGAAIIVGLPANLISIVVVGRLLEKNEQRLIEISKQFSQSTIVSVDGRILIRKREEVDNSAGNGR